MPACWGGAAVCAERAVRAGVLVEHIPVPDQPRDQLRFSGGIMIVILPVGGWVTVGHAEMLA